MIIDRIQVTLEPWRFAGTDEIQLRVRVDAMGQKLNFAETLRPSDIESRFDVFFDRAKSALLAELKKQDSAVTP